MLVLSRKVGQRLVIDDRITIIVNRVAGNRVQIGVEAPEDVHIMRGELNRIRRQFSDDDPAWMSDPAQIGFGGKYDAADDVTSRSIH